MILVYKFVSFLSLLAFVLSFSGRRVGLAFVPFLSDSFSLACCLFLLFLVVGSWFGGDDGDGVGGDGGCVS